MYAHPALRARFPPSCRVHHLPLLSTMFELEGLGVSAWFAYKWFFVAGEREAATREISSFVDKLGL